MEFLFYFLTRKYLSFFFPEYNLQVDFDISDHWAEPIIYSSKDDWSSNLNIMLQWSPFASKDEIMLQVQFWWNATSLEQKLLVLHFIISWCDYPKASLPPKFSCINILIAIFVSCWDLINKQILLWRNTRNKVYPGKIS